MSTPNITCEGFDFSLLQATQYQLIFDKIPHVPFFCHAVTVPDLQLNFATYSTPFHDVNIPGEKLKYSNLVAEILIDKRMITYKEVHDWMRRISMRDGVSTDDVSICKLIIAESTEIVMEGVFPLSISPINLRSNAIDTEPLIFSAVFNVVSFEIL